MHTDRAFAETLVRFGECAHTAAELVAGIRDEAERVHRLTSIIRAMARFFWFTVEFGLMRSKDGLRVYGSGLLSSFGEIEHAIDSPEVQRYPIQLEWAINQAFEIDHYQPLLFIVDSFDHLFSLVDELESWMREGKLDNVAPGEPAVNERDLKSFLQQGVAQGHAAFAGTCGLFQILSSGFSGSRTSSISIGPVRFVYQAALDHFQSNRGSNQALGRGIVMTCNAEFGRILLAYAGCDRKSDSAKLAANTREPC